MSHIFLQRCGFPSSLRTTVRGIAIWAMTQRCEGARDGGVRVGVCGGFAGMEESLMGDGGGPLELVLFAEWLYRGGTSGPGQVLYRGLEAWLKERWHSMLLSFNLAKRFRTQDVESAGMDYPGITKPATSPSSTLRDFIGSTQAAMPTSLTYRSFQSSYDRCLDTPQPNKNSARHTPRCPPCLQIPHRQRTAAHPPLAPCHPPSQRPPERAIRGRSCIRPVRGPPLQLANCSRNTSARGGLCGVNATKAGGGNTCKCSAEGKMLACASAECMHAASPGPHSRMDCLCSEPSLG